VSFQTELISIAIRAMTGVLYTDSQIKSITSGATGKYLKEFFPSTKDELEAKNRVDAARNHIEAASTIIRDMQEDLEAQDLQLNELLDTIKEKKKLADRYQTLADTNKEAFDAFKIEMEEALRKELVEQAIKGKRTRQVISFILWGITLVIGAALGSYFKDVLAWLGFA
jgi:DNA repair ATPase RecN